MPAHKPPLTLFIRLIKFSHAFFSSRWLREVAAAALLGRADPRGADPRRAEAVRRQGLRRHLDARDRGCGQRQYRLDRLSFRRQGRAARSLRRLHRRHDPGIAAQAFRPRAAAPKGAAEARRRSSTPRWSGWSASSSRSRRPARSCSSCCASWRIRPRRSTDLRRRVRADASAGSARSGQQATGEDRPRASAPRSPFSRMIGQVIYFRIGREAVMRRHGLDTISARSEAAAVIAVAKDNLAAILRRPQRQRGHELPLFHPAAAHRCLQPAPGQPPLAVGYVEGEYVLLAPIEVAQVETVSVRRGDRVKAGDAGRRRWKPRDADDRGGAGRSRAGARREAQLADLQDRQAAGGDRRAGGDAANRPRRRTAEAERVLARLADLLKRGIATQADYDHGRDRAGRRPTRDGRTGGGQSGRRQAAGARRRRSRPPRTRSSRRRRRSSRRSGGFPSARSRRRRRAASTTSSATPATSPARRRRCISMLPDGAVKLRLYRARRRASPR